MIIELPLHSQATSERYKMALFAFSNNNLSIRKRCAKDIDGYDPSAEKSEDVDLCFRVAQNEKWVVCQEAEATVRHRARQTIMGFLTQMWGWGWYLGYAYQKTGFRGMYLYWINSKAQRCAGSLEVEAKKGFRYLAICFFTDFHAMHLCFFGSLIAVVFGHSLIALCGALIGLFFFWRYARDVLASSLPLFERLQVALLQYLGNLSVMSAAFLGALRRGVFLLPASILRPLDSK